MAPIIKLHDDPRTKPRQDTWSIVDIGLWERFMANNTVTALLPPPEGPLVMAAGASSGTASSVTLSENDQQSVVSYLVNQTLEGIMHDILLEVHLEEKVARMQTAVVELEQRAEKFGKKLNETPEEGDPPDDGEPVETKAAALKAGKAHLKGNPMRTLKHIRCPNCRLLRLLYPRVGFNARPPPDPTQQYCKNEPMIILDKHDVHGQRKKGVRIKGQPKSKGKKKTGVASPASENSDPLTPSSSMPVDSFEFKEIEYPAAKCPNRRVADHWKAVNIFATHLNGTCFLKQDRKALQEAKEKMNSTPRDSRANSPKAPVTNGTKRKAREEDSIASTKKKQKTGDGKKNAKATPAPSKLREQTSTTADDESTETPIKAEANGDTIQVAPKAKDASEEPSVKLKLNGPSSSAARKKPSKTGKKA